MGDHSRSTTFLTIRRRKRSDHRRQRPNECAPMKDGRVCVTARIRTREITASEEMRPVAAAAARGWSAEALLPAVETGSGGNHLTSLRTLALSQSSTFFCRDTAGSAQMIHASHRPLSRLASFLGGFARVNPGRIQDRKGCVPDNGVRKTR